MRASIKMAGIVVVLFLAAAIAAPAQSFLSPSDLATKSLTDKSSDRKYAARLASLPGDAQGPIAATLGKNDSRYWLRPSADGFRAENPGQGLGMKFTKEGGEVESHNRHWGLVTRAYGYGDRLDRVRMVEPDVSANRVEYRRNGITEWYVNGPLGLEQGFTLTHRPGKANGQALTLELGLRGDLVAALDPAGKGLELKDKDGKRALRYTGLSARDASGRELASWLEIRGERLLVRVEDGGAQYPVVVDPFVQQAELTASGGFDNNELGTSVALSGSTIVVGGLAETAFVFVESGGTWTEQAELTASDNTTDPALGVDFFGFSVAISGATIVVGSPGHIVGDDLSSPQQGAVYVFVESGGTWIQQAELTASDGTAGDNFGFSVAFNGTEIVAGAPFHTVDSNNSQGAAYVFGESNGTWSQQAELTASDDGGGFGVSVALSRSTIVVGAVNHTVGSNLLQGAAYVFVRKAGAWSQQAELTASDGAADDQFGQSVAVSGTTIVVGAPAPGIATAFVTGRQGAAYVFCRRGGTWIQQAKLTASDGTANNHFGFSVALSGSTIAVGAPTLFNQFGPGPDGAAYVFIRSGGTWSQQAELTVPDEDGGQNNLFGASVVANDSTIIVGDPSQMSIIAAGAVYVYAQQ